MLGWIGYVFMFELIIVVRGLGSFDWLDLGCVLVRDGEVLFNCFEEDVGDFFREMLG